MQSVFKKNKNIKKRKIYSISWIKNVIEIIDLFCYASQIENIIRYIKAYLRLNNCNINIKVTYNIKITDFLFIRIIFIVFIIIFFYK